MLKEFYLFRKNSTIIDLEIIYNLVSFFIYRNQMNTIFNIFLFLFFPFLIFTFSNIYAQQSQQPLGAENITVYDPTLKIELVAAGLDFPTTMAFLGPDDFLILEKNTGNVKRVVNTTLIDKPLLHVNTNIKDERGLLGIAVSQKKNFYDNPFFIDKSKYNT